MQITFLGATETVTDSKYLLSFDNKKNILIDCGLFQITHGELEAALSLKSKIKTELGWNCIMPPYIQTEQLT